MSSLVSEVSTELASVAVALRVDGDESGRVFRDVREAGVVLNHGGQWTAAPVTFRRDEHGQLVAEIGSPVPLEAVEMSPVLEAMARKQARRILRQICPDPTFIDAEFESVKFQNPVTAERIIVRGATRSTDVGDPYIDPFSIEFAIGTRSLRVVCMSAYSEDWVEREPGVIESLDA